MLSSQAMALYEYFCKKCKLRFEQLSQPKDPDKGRCPKCHSRETEKLISRFAVGGQGDLRESTQHGCHSCDVTGPGEHSHSHSSSDEE